MEIPQSRSRSRPRPYAAEGRKPTHDFLSLCSPAHQDPSPSQGGFLKTHDFLQPLERGGKNAGKEGYKAEVTSSEKSLPPAPPSSGEHILPGGIGTYSISHIANYISQGQRTPKPEGVVFTAPQSSSSDRNDENSNCSSYTGSGFTLWEESVVKKGKTGKENIAGNRHLAAETGMKEGGAAWMASIERPSQSSSIHNHPSTTFSSLSSSQPSVAKKNHSFVDLMKSSKSVPEEEDDEDEFVIKKETSPNHKGVLSVKVDTRSTDQKPNTPRSKHSATEQRRRSKINDRFSMLRELIPHGDQKRDKASFLLEVIDYIQFLQEKVNKYEHSYQGWNNEPTKLTPWGNGHRPSDGLTEQPRPLVFAAKFEENNSNIAPTFPRKDPNIVESDMSSADTIKEMVNHSRLTNQASAFPVRLLPNVFSPAAASFPSRLASDADNPTSPCQSRLWHGRSCATDCTVASDKLKEQDLTIESGTISISTVYSQGLLSTLTQALQTSGVDLSHATISVQIDLGKRANHRVALNSSTSLLKKTDVPSSNQGLAHTRLASTREETDRAVKRFKTSRN